MSPISFDWHASYLAEDMPWDLGEAHPELVARLAAGDAPLQPSRPGARAFVPGCGRGWDALALAQAGFAVTAVDLVGEVEALVTPMLEAAGGQFVRGDALTYSEPERVDEPFELLLEHTFFCAIHPGRRTEYGALAQRIIAPGGHLCALVFPVDKPEEKGGPPFGIDASLLAQSLGEEFELLESAPVLHPAQGRKWTEAWATFRRRA